MRSATGLVRTADAVAAEYGLPIVNRRISVTPISWVAAACEEADPLPFSRALDRAAVELGVDFVGGYSALVQKGATRTDARLMASLPEALGSTRRVCGCVNAASSR